MSRRLTAKRLREFLHYDPETGIFTRRVSSRGKRGKRGEVAGTIRGTKRPYRRIKIDGKSYFAHRLAWLYVKGRWPKDQIDHKNGVYGDDRFINLREATAVENARNKRRNKTSKLKGAIWGKYSKSWRAQINIRGKTTHLGKFDTPEEAHAAYCRAAIKYFGEFARFE